MIQFAILAKVRGELTTIENLALVAARYAVITTSQNGELGLLYSPQEFGDRDATMLEHMRGQLWGGCAETQVLTVEGHLPFTHVAFFPDAGTYLLQMEEREASSGSVELKPAGPKTLRDYGLTVKQGMTTPSKAGKQPKPVWEVDGATHGYESLLYDLGGKKWRGSFSFWEDPTEKILAALSVNDERESYSDRLQARTERAEARAERYKDYAENAEARFETLYNQAREMASGIPFGQPILVGHHSEKRDRNYREKIHNKFGKAFEERDKAKHYEEKARGAARTAAPKDLGFMSRRLKEAKAELGRCRRTLESVRTSASPFYTDEIRAREIARFGRLIAEYEERVAHWEGEIASAGGVQFSKETAKGEVAIKKGDVVHWKGWSGRVLRVNPTTVTVDVNAGNGWKPKVLYGEITKHEPAGTAE